MAGRRVPPTTTATFRPLILRWEQVSSAEGPRSFYASSSSASHVSARLTGLIDVQPHVDRQKLIHCLEMSFGNGDLKAGERIECVCYQRAIGNGCEDLPILEGTQDVFAEAVLEVSVRRNPQLQGFTESKKNRVARPF